MKVSPTRSQLPINCIADCHPGCDEYETLEIQLHLGAQGAGIWEELELRVPSDYAAKDVFCKVERAYCIVESIIGAYINFISTSSKGMYLEMEYLLLLTLPSGPSDMKGLAVKFS